MVNCPYVTARGHALLDFRLYLPKAWCEDKAGRDRAKVPADVEFKTKTELGTRVIRGAIGVGVPSAWVAGDEVASPRCPGPIGPGPSRARLGPGYATATPAPSSGGSSTAPAPSASAATRSQSASTAAFTHPSCGALPPDTTVPWWHGRRLHLEFS